MVDPKRKINHLSDDDAAFLVECEHEFRNRYTEADAEFAAFVAKPTRPPPIIDAWKINNSGQNWNRNNYRQNNRNNYNNRYNDNRNDNRNQRHHRQNYSRPYDRDYRREGQSSDYNSSRPH